MNDKTTEKCLRLQRRGVFQQTPRGVPKVILKRQKQLHVRRVIEKQIQLNVFVPRTLRQSRVQHVRFRRNTLRIHTVRVLPSRSFQYQNVFADCRVTFAVATLIARFRRNSQGNSAEIRRVTIARGRKANRACVGLFIRRDEKAGLTNGMR